jgi:hypothetical protein
MRRLIPLLALLLAACAINEGANPAAPPSGAIFAPEATATPRRTAGEREEAPKLLDPDDGAQVFLTEDFALLAWDWHRALEPGEIFEVLAGRVGQAPTHVSYSQALVFNATAWFRGQPPGQYVWSVRVVSTNLDDAEARPITESAPVFALDVQGSQVVLPRATATAAALVDRVIAEVPEGYTATLFAQTRGSRITSMLFGRDRQLYVLKLSGQISRLSDADGDGFAEDEDIVYDNTLDRAVSMALDPINGTLYIAYAGQVASLRDSNSDGLLDSLSPLVELPPGAATVAPGNTITIGPDGTLYIAEVESGDIFRIAAEETDDETGS